MEALPQRETDLLERVQHQAARMVPGLAKLDYEVRLEKMDLSSEVPVETP